MKKIITLLALFSCVAATLCAQEKVEEDDARWQTIISTKVPASARMDAGLYQLAVLAQEDKAEALQRLRRSELLHDSAGRVNVEIVYRNNENLERITDRIDAEYLRGLGFAVDQTWRNRASIWVPLEEVLQKCGSLSADYHTFLVTIPRHDDEGPGVMNSNTYNGAAPPGGAGRRIAIFDGGFEDLQGAISAGKAKTPAYVGIGAIPSSLAGVNTADNEHGTACVETVYDNAPDAIYEVYANYNPTMKGAAVDSCIAHGVHIISMSQSEYNKGWGDNTGAACAYAQAAADAGILFITSCGNRAESHYEAFLTDANGNGNHEFAGLDETNNLTADVADSQDVNVYLSWNTSGGTDLDVYVRRVSDNVTLASSAAGGTAYEYTSWTNNTGAPVAVYIQVVRYNGPATTFEMFSHNAGNYQYATAAGSNTSPSNTTDPNVISVGAVNYWDYGSAPGTAGIIASYSSRGPTNSGNIAPKITGPTATTTRAYNGAFTGTSCSTPNVAGAMCAFWSANPLLDATGVRQIMMAKAAGYKDWGAGGTDNIYGAGGLFLYPWATSVRYMLRSSENTGITNNTRPFQTLLAAEQQTPANGTVIILNSGNYSETGLYGTIFAGSGKSILYRSPFPSVTGNFGF